MTPASQTNLPIPRQEDSKLGTVLVVDDDEMVRTLIRALLEACGLVVEEASDAIGALQKAEMLKESLSVLVTDLIMPGMSGTQLAYTLRRTHGDVSVVFMSGCHAGEQLQKLFERTTYLQKPFSRAKLINAVRAGLLNVSTQSSTSNVTFQ